MATSEDYSRVLRSAWAGSPTKGNRKVGSKEMAVRAAQAMYREVTGKPIVIKAKSVKYVTGNRRSSYGRDSAGGWILNVEQTWQSFTHELGHWLFFRLRQRAGERPHCDRHLMLEAQLARMIVARGYADAEPAAPKPKPKVDIVVSRFAAMKRRHERLSEDIRTLQRRVATKERTWAELRRRIADYEKRHGDRLAAKSLESQENKIAKGGLLRPPPAVGVVP